jgi:hypothetical protein
VGSQWLVQLVREQRSHRVTPSKRVRPAASRAASRRRGRRLKERASRAPWAVAGGLKEQARR